jgi:hypothetical protein
MRKTNPQHRWHVTPNEKHQIRRLTLRGVRQSVISRKLGISAPSVGKAQIAMALPTHLVWPEKQILQLFKSGWGGYRIHRHLHVPVNQIYAIAHRAGFKRKDGIGYPEPRGDVSGFIEAVKSREGYIGHLAKKFGVASCQASKLAHEVLKTVQFRPGASKPPLSSNFPQKHYKRGLAD